MALPRNILEASSRVVQISPRFSPGARPWRRLGYPNRQCGLGGASVWTFTGNRARRAAIWKPTPAKGSRVHCHRSKLARANVHTVLFDELTNHKTRRRATFCSVEARACDAYASYGHKTAILGAIDSIHWLHDCRHSSLVVAACNWRGSPRVQGATRRRCGRRVPGATRRRRGRRRPCAPAPTMN